MYWFGERLVASQIRHGFMELGICRPLWWSVGWFHDRRSVGQLVLIRVPLGGPLPDFSFLSSIMALLSVGRPLWREERSVIYILGTPQSEPRRTHNQTLRSHLRLRSPYLYPPRQVSPVTSPDIWVPFSSPLTTSRDMMEYILTRLHTGTLTVGDIILWMDL
jgi:hypothetical protein